MSGESPESVSAAFAAALAARDLPAAVAMWLDDALMIQADGQATHGRDAIEAALGAVIDNDVDVDIRLARIYTAGDVAVGLGTLAISGRGGDGQAFEQRSQSVIVYARGTDGRWRLAIDAPWGLPRS